jgi:hypothetical protein
LGRNSLGSAPRRRGSRRKAHEEACALSLVAVAAAGILPASADPGMNGGADLFARGGYDARRPCQFYRINALPAPRHCRRHYLDYYGKAVTDDGDFVFKNQIQFDGWKDDADYRRWRNHDYRER